MNKIIALGPGKSSLDFKNDGTYKVLAFQRVFPHCVEHLNVFPDYWTCGDPYAFMEGFDYLLKNKNLSKNNLKILMPDTFLTDVSTYRKSFGTTPLMRTQNGWQKLTSMTKQISNYYEVKSIPVVTTKFLQLHAKDNNELKMIFDENQEFIRFMTEKVVFGTVEFDSEIVTGFRFKWGLENKLTSNVLPVCHYLGSSKVKIYGFDYRGPRFYSPDARHPWNDETQEGSEVIEFSLKILKTWLEWKNIHGMEIVSGTKDIISLPNKLLKYESN